MKFKYNKKLAASWIIIFLAFNSCEKIDVVEVELQHISKYVIQAEVIGGEIFKGVTITRTLPITEEYDIKKTEIKNAVAYLKINGVQVVTLKYFENGVYNTLDDFRIVEGNNYELFARIDEELIYAKTFVPFEPVVENINITDENYLEVNISVKGTEVYGSIWTVNVSSNPDNAVKDSDFHSIVGASDDNSKIAFSRTSVIPGNYLTPFYWDLLSVQVFSFDEAYKDYFNSKQSNQPINDSFAQGGGIVNWNVHGTNTIGLFIGFTKGKIIKVR